MLALLGDPGALTYKRSRRETSEIDAIAAYVLAGDGAVIPFTPYGYDERQLCSPGFDLPAGRLTRSVNGGYPQYHTSADDLSLITPTALQGSLEACQRIVDVIESNQRYVNLKPKGEPRLGARGLYGALGGNEPEAHQYAMLWILNQSDGAHSLLDIARRSGLPFAVLREAARALEAAELLASARGRSSAVSRGAARPPVAGKTRRRKS